MTIWAAPTESSTKNRCFVAVPILLVSLASHLSSNARRSRQSAQLTPTSKPSAGSNPGSPRKLQQKGLPALSIALVDDQKIVWARGFGVRRRRQTRPGRPPIPYIASARCQSSLPTWPSCSLSSRARSISTQRFPGTFPNLFRSIRTGLRSLCGN